jgi:hypothetical protein
LLSDDVNEQVSLDKSRFSLEDYLAAFAAGLCKRSSAEGQSQSLSANVYLEYPFYGIFAGINLLATQIAMSLRTPP